MEALTGIFDSHAHYDDPAFDPDREELLAALPGKGVERVLTIGADLPTSRAAVDLAERWPFLWAAVGVHPHGAGDLPGDWLEQLEALAASPRVRAIGEIGYDYHYDLQWKNAQKAVFSAQLELAARLGLPVIIHDREAHGDTMELLRRYRPAGVVHCFSGSAEMAREVVSRDRLPLHGPRALPGEAVRQQPSALHHRQAGRHQRAGAPGPCRRRRPKRPPALRPVNRQDSTFRSQVIHSLFTGGDYNGSAGAGSFGSAGDKDPRALSRFAPRLTRLFPESLSFRAGAVEKNKWESAPF